MHAMREVGASPGRGGHRRSLEAGRIMFQAREAAAALFSAPDSSRIIFTHSATEALNMALRGTLVPGDHVITTSMEHNSLVRPAAPAGEAGRGADDRPGRTGRCRRSRRYPSCSDAAHPHDRHRPCLQRVRLDPADRPDLRHSPGGRGAVSAGCGPVSRQPADRCGLLRYRPAGCPGA